MRGKWSGRKYAGFILILAFLLCSVNILPAEKGPRIKFKRESWDFGNVKEGEVLNYAFTFKNEGDETLTIRSVRTSCGCTAALASDEKIPPNKEGKIKITFNTRGYTGKVTKYVFIESNDSNQPQKQLALSAQIEVPPTPKINLSAYSLDVGLVVENEELQARPRIENKGELELEVTCTHKNASFFSRGRKISFPLRIAAGKEEEVEVRMPPPKSKGVVREYIMIRSNDPMRPNLSLSLTGYVVTKTQLRELFARYKDILK